MNKKLKSANERINKCYIEFDMIDAYESAILLLEDLRNDFNKSVLKGSKTSGIRFRRGLLNVRSMLKDIQKHSIEAERAAKENQPDHANKLNPKGVREALSRRNIELNNE